MMTMIQRVIWTAQLWNKLKRTHALRGRPHRILRDPWSFNSLCRASAAWSAVIHIFVTER
jgi:hypothetical protein